MSQSENQRAFQERLAKIEARENPGESVADKFRKQRKKGSSNQKRRGNMVMATILLLGISAIPILKQKYPEQFALPSLTAFLADDTAEADIES